MEQIIQLKIHNTVRRFKFLHKYENLHTDFVLSRVDIERTYKDSVYNITIIIVAIFCTVSITVPER